MRRGRRGLGKTPYYQDYREYRISIGQCPICNNPIWEEGAKRCYDCQDRRNMHYASRKARSLCVDCGEPLTESDKGVRCEECQDANKRDQRRYRRAHPDKQGQLKWRKKTVQCPRCLARAISAGHRQDKTGARRERDQLQDYFVCQNCKTQFFTMESEWVRNPVLEDITEEDQ